MYKYAIIIMVIIVECSIKINEFEGPLDLLLHLIKQSNLNIYDIRLEEVINQYLNYINSQEKLNISIDSSYLVMAAELMEIKSRLLLPDNKQESDDNYEEEIKNNLINKLVEYKKYKELMPTFKELEEKRKEIFIKSPDDISLYADANSIIMNDEGAIDDLLNAFKLFLDRQKLAKPLSTKVTIKEYSVYDRIKDIKNILLKEKKIDFIELFDIYEKDYIIITFLSILEMAKDNIININQGPNFGKIILELKDVK